MFQLSEEQLRVLDAGAAARQDAFMARLIGEALPDLLPGVEATERQRQLLEWVDTGCERVAQLGVLEPPDMAVVVTLQLARTLLNAEEQEKLRLWSSSALRRTGSSGAVKVALVEGRLRRAAAADPLAQRLLSAIAQVRGAYKE